MVLQNKQNKQNKAVEPEVSAEHFKKRIIFLKNVEKTYHNNQQIKNKKVKANLRIRKFRGKNKDEMKKFGKMGSILRFSISKLHYIAI